MYTHFKLQHEGYAATYYDRLDTRGGLVVPVALGCTVVSLAQTEQRRSIVPATDAETWLITGKPSLDELRHMRAEAIAGANVHPSLGDMVAKAKNTWHDLLSGEVAERVDVGFTPRYRDLPRDETTTPSGLTVISSEQEFVAALDEPPREFVGYAATADEMEAMEEIAQVARLYGAQPGPTGLPIGNYM